MKVNNLPDLILRTIFSKVPLLDLLQAGYVCGLWGTYQQAITEKVNSITLLIGDKSCWYSSPLDQMNRSCFTIPHRDELHTENGLPMFPSQFGNESSHLAYASFDVSSVYALVEALPNVNTLNIAINGIEPSVINHVIFLLKLWSTKLVTLKIWCYLSKKNENFLTSQLFLLLQSINKLPILEHLTLDFKHRILEITEIKNFPNLSRLREFFISTSDTSCGEYFRWLEEFMLGPAIKLERIGFGGTDNWSFLLDYQNSPVAQKFTVISSDVTIDWINYEQFENIPIIFSKFNSLASLNCDYFTDSDRPFDQFINNFVPLDKLIHLKLDIYSNYHWPSLSIYDEIPSNRFAQLSSVKVLSLYLLIHRHSDIESDHWGRIFPNVQVLVVKHKCIFTCSIHEIVQEKKKEDQLTEGIRGLLHTFKQCPSLRRIYTHFPVQKKWDIEEI